MGDGVAALPTARVTLNATQFRTGQTLTIGIDVQNPAGAPPADLYIGALFPDSTSAVFFTAPGVVGGSVSLTVPASFARMQSSAPLSQASFFQFTFPPSGIPPGTY